MNSAQEIADGIVQLLEKRGQMSLLPSIIEVLQSRNSGLSRQNIAVVRTAIPLNSSEKELILSQLSSMFGRQLHIEEQLDETIVGGMYIQVGDTVLDYTLSSHLQQISDQIEK